MGGRLVYTLARKPARGHAQSSTINIPLRFFTEEEALPIAAAAVHRAR